MYARGLEMTWAIGCYDTNKQHLEYIRNVLVTHHSAFDPASRPLSLPYSLHHADTDRGNHTYNEHSRRLVWSLLPLFSTYYYR